MKIKDEEFLASRAKFVAVSLLYSSLLIFIYLDEIVRHWSYMGFNGTFSIFGLALSLTSIFVISFLFPIENSARSYILITMMFFSFIPSIIFFSFASNSLQHSIVFFIAIAIVFLVSSINLKFPYINFSNNNTYMYIIASIIVLALISQAAVGGLQDFNLDIERVYDFRREAASRIPPFFAYVYSNVSSTLIPILVVMSLKLKRYLFLVLSFIMTLFMFGMSHHKSVLFGPIFVAILYMFFSTPKLRSNMIWIFLSVPILSLIDISLVRSSAPDDFSYATSLIIRRVLFVPGMADGAYIDFFSQNVKYYWSYSSILSWAIDSPYNMTPPFLIGYEYFSDLDTSANTGIIGSGFANAGLLGVTIYAIATGVLISIFNFFGEKIDRAVVAAISLTTVFNILTSTDLLTAFLTHGLLLLLVLLVLYPRPSMKAV